jgi:hypothetical protein
MLKPDVNQNAIRYAHGERPTLSHFIRYIEGKPLRVTLESRETSSVKDEEGEEWELRRSDICSPEDFENLSFRNNLKTLDKGIDVLKQWQKGVFNA